MFDISKYPFAFIYLLYISTWNGPHHAFRLVMFGVRLQKRSDHCLYHNSISYCSPARDFSISSYSMILLRSDHNPSDPTHCMDWCWLITTIGCFIIRFVIFTSHKNDKVLDKPCCNNTTWVHCAGRDTLESTRINHVSTPSIVTSSYRDHVWRLSLNFNSKLHNQWFTWLFN